MIKKLLKTHKIYILTLILCFIFIIGSFTNVFGIMSTYEETNFKTGIVRAKSLNVRKGPGLNFAKISSLKKDEYIRIFAKIGDWYVIQTEENIIGTAYSKYIDAIYPNSAQTNSNSLEITTSNSETKSNNIKNMNTKITDENITIETSSDSIEENYSSEQPLNVEMSEQTSTTNLSIDEEKLLNLINTERTNSGLPALEMDDELQNAARVKAEDMKKNKYFSHASPEYGSPFDMLKHFNVSYKTAGENIAGNSSIEGAFNAWINSEEHKKNILSNIYNYTGIGIVESSEYGKILVQLFIGK